MWIELGTMIISSLLTVAGVGLNQLNLEAVSTPAVSCLTESADNCLASDVCDVFISAGGNEVCGLACDMRSVDTCAMDSNCAVVDGACDYADHSPVGC